MNPDRRPPSDLDAELADLLRDSLTAVAATTPFERPAPDERRNLVPLVAAGVLVVAGVGAVVAFGRGADAPDAVGSSPSDAVTVPEAPLGTSTVAPGPGGEIGSAPVVTGPPPPVVNPPRIGPTTSAPSSPPVIAPSPDLEGLVVRSTTRVGQSSQDAVPLVDSLMPVPGGPVIGVSVQPSYCSGEPDCGAPEGDSVATIVEPSQVVPSLVAGSGPGVLSYVIPGRCVTVTLQAPPSVPEGDDLIQDALSGVHVDGGSVQVDLPASWSNLGGSLGTERFVVSFDAVVDGEVQSFELFVEPGGTLGHLLGGAAATVVRAQLGDGRAFLSAISDEDGDPSYSLVWYSQVGPASLSGTASPEGLVTVAEAMVDIPWDEVADAYSVPQPGVPTLPAVTTTSAPPLAPADSIADLDCVPSLEVVSTATG